MAVISTTWTSPASATLDKATGATIDETMTDALASNLYHLGGTTGHIGCSAFHGTSHSVANTTLTTLALSGERYDTDPNGAIHDTVTNNSRLTCRTAGVYLILGQVTWISNATGLRRLHILGNGTTNYAIVTQNPVTGENHSMMISTLLLMAAGDYVELQGYQSSGGALSTGADTFSVIFTMTKV
jgi:hypothetical protein